MDSRFRGNDGSKQETMNQQHANFDSDQRRAGIRRTAWVVGGIALVIFVLFFVKQGVWH
jgi:type VI protein secretion system component VasF